MKSTTILCAILTLFSIHLGNNDKNSVVPEKSKHVLNDARQTNFLTKKIQSTNIHDLKIEQIVNDLMPNKVIEKIENLYDIQFELMYYLVTFEDFGYMIYDIETQDYQEYSETSLSPYLKHQNEIKVYVGPGNYCHVSNGQLKDIASDKTLTAIEQNNLSIVYETIQSNKEQAENDSFVNSIDDANAYVTLPGTYSLPFSY